MGPIRTRKRDVLRLRNRVKKSDVNARDRRRQPECTVEAHGGKGGGGGREGKANVGKPSEEQRDPLLIAPLSSSRLFVRASRRRTARTSAVIDSGKRNGETDPTVQ